MKPWRLFVKFIEKIVQVNNVKFLFFVVVIFAFLSILALTGAVLSQVVPPVDPNPNPCEGVTTTDTFVNDWASCDSYFWCNGAQAIPSGPCPAGFEFDEVQQLCSLIDPAVPCEECPATGSLLVGVATDTTCMTAEACNAGTRDPTFLLTCPLGLRFDRVSGNFISNLTF